MNRFIIEKLWYGRHPLKWILMPFSWAYCFFITARRWYLNYFYSVTCSVPVIVVGNITVGGVGKTPLVIELVKKIQSKGLSVGVVSRGYGSKIQSFPYEIKLNDKAQQVGDEPLMIAKKVDCPVVIAQKRIDAVDYLIKKHHVQLIISDDGLQHYHMGRAVEIAVVDGQRGFGNGCCLPAGPLREPKYRLNQVDFVVVNEGNGHNAHQMYLKPNKIINLINKKETNIQCMHGNVAAVAGIGNPERFYITLHQLGIKFTEYTYPDHYQFKPSDLDFKESIVIMTEKDAVKCGALLSEGACPFADKFYYLSVEAVLSTAFWEDFWSHQQLQGFV